MDKLISGVIIVAVVVFFYWLYTQGGMDQAEMEPAGADTMEMGEAETEGAEGEGPWTATIGTGEDAKVAGQYESYEECYQAVSGMVDINVTAYSCTQ